MGQHLAIDSDEAFAMASELVALTGETMPSAVTEALRLRVERERARQKEYEELMAAAAEFRRLFDDPPPGSDHSWLYDEETGLPA